MTEFFDKWTPGQFTLLVMTVGIAVTLVVFILAITHYQMRALADSSALERERLAAGQALRLELLRRNLPPTDLKLALDALGLEAGAVPPAADTAQAVANLLACAGDASPAEVEEGTALVVGAGPDERRVAAEVLQKAADEGQAGPAVLAVVRAVCRPAAGPAGAPKSDLDLRFDRELVTS